MFTLSPKGPKHREKFQDQVLAAYQDRMSLRGIHRTFGVCYLTVMRWLGEKTEALPAIVDTLLPAENGDVLELDELWSFVQSKAQQLWLWVALCRRTRQIVAWTLGDRSLQRACDLRCPARGIPATRHPQRRVGGLPGSFPKAHASLLHQSRRRDLPRRALVWQPARPRQPLGAPRLLLCQVPGEPSRRHPLLLHHHLQLADQAINIGVNTTHRSTVAVPAAATSG